MGLVLPQPHLTPFATVHLKQELEALLQRPVDLVRLHERMNPDLRQSLERIERKARPVGLAGDGVAGAPCAPTGS